jgi:hypothetical protein
VPLARRRHLRDHATDPSAAQRARLGDCVGDGSAARPERHRRNPVGDEHDQRNGVRVPDQLAPQEQPRAPQRVGERRLAAERDLLQAAARARAAAGRREHDRALRDPALESDERDLVPAPRRLVQEFEDDALHPLDHPFGVHRPAVVDDEADAERRAVLAHAAPQILGPHRQRRTARARGRGAERRVDGEVVVPVPREPVA